MDLHHPLVSEFPEYRDTIRKLKTEDPEFLRLFDEYHQLDYSIYRIEEEIEVATDSETEELKKRRAFLKDKAYHALRVANGELHQSR